MKKVFYTGEEFIVKGDVVRAFYNTDCFYFPETMKDNDAVNSLYHGNGPISIVKLFCYGKNSESLSRLTRSGLMRRRRSYK